MIYEMVQELRQVQDAISDWLQRDDVNDDPFSWDIIMDLLTRAASLLEEIDRISD